MSARAPGCEKWRSVGNRRGRRRFDGAGFHRRMIQQHGGLRSSTVGSEHGEMALWVLEKAPFSAIFHHLFGDFSPSFSPSSHLAWQIGANTVAKRRLLAEDHQEARQSPVPVRYDTRPAYQSVSEGATVATQETRAIPRRRFGLVYAFPLDRERLRCRREARDSGHPSLTLRQMLPSGHDICTGTTLSHSAAPTICPSRSRSLARAPWLVLSEDAEIPVAQLGPKWHTFPEGRPAVCTPIKPGSAAFTGCAKLARGPRPKSCHFVPNRGVLL